MNFSAKEDENRDELEKFLKAWSLGKDGVSFTANITSSGQLSKTLVTIDAHGNIKSAGDERQFKVTRERYHFDQAERCLQIRPSSRGASITFTPVISD